MGFYFLHPARGKLWTFLNKPDANITSSYKIATFFFGSSFPLLGPPGCLIQTCLLPLGLYFLLTAVSCQCLYFINLTPCLLIPTCLPSFFLAPRRYFLQVMLILSTLSQSLLITADAGLNKMLLWILLASEFGYILLQTLNLLTFSGFLLLASCGKLWTFFNKPDDNIMGSFKIVTFFFW